MAGVQLIVTPMSLSFQAPFVHSQKRLITLLNPSDQDVIYRIHIDNDKDFGVSSMRGSVKAFDTTELTVTLAPVKEDLPECSLVVTSIPKVVLADEEDAEWNTTNVQIELDPKKTPRQGDETLGMRLQGEDIAKIIEQQPGCDYSAQKKSDTPKSKLRGFLYLLGILAVVVTGKCLRQNSECHFIMLHFQLISSMTRTT